MIINTKFDLGEYVFLLKNGHIKEYKIARINVNYHNAGLRDISYELYNSAGLFGADSLFMSKSEAGEKLLADNGLDVALKEMT